MAIMPKEEYERRLTKNDRRLSEDSENERRFVRKMSEVLDPDEFSKMKSLIQYLDLHNSITPKKLLILLADFFPQQEDILKL